MSSSRNACIVTAGALAAGAVAVAFWPTERDVAVRPAAPAPMTIALHCQFYVFVESRPFVAFLMEQAADDRSLYRQAYVAKADGDRTDYNALTDRRPEWRLDGSSDPRRLESRVVVPDAGPAGVGEEDIAIELQEFDPARADGVWREASLRSVYYQNLPGKCRQAKAPGGGQRADG
jgi:hypothetical protein